MSRKKLYYKIGEACRELDIQPYVLRYWETEFHLLKPDKSRSGQRVYSSRDLAVIRRIKELLYEEGYTIAGAKKRLDQESLAADFDDPDVGDLSLDDPDVDDSEEVEPGDGEPQDNEPGGPIDTGAGEEPTEAEAPHRVLAVAAHSTSEPADPGDLDTRAVERVQTMARRARELRSQAQQVLDRLKRFG